MKILGSVFILIAAYDYKCRRDIFGPLHLNWNQGTSYFLLNIVQRFKSLTLSCKLDNVQYLNHSLETQTTTFVILQNAYHCYRNPSFLGNQDNWPWLG